MIENSEIFNKAIIFSLKDYIMLYFSDDNNDDINNNNCLINE